MKSRHGLEIRAAAPADAPDICAMLAAAGHDLQPTAMARRLEAIRQSPAAVLIAAEWGPPSGLVALHWHRGLDDDRPKARVTALFVAPDDRRRGIGRLLLKAAAQAARAAGCDEIAVEVPPGLPALTAFCEANGFVISQQLYARPLRKRT